MLVKSFERIGELRDRVVLVLLPFRNVCCCCFPCCCFSLQQRTKKPQRREPSSLEMPQPHTQENARSVPHMPPGEILTLWTPDTGLLLRDRFGLQETKGVRVRNNGNQKKILCRHFYHRSECDLGVSCGFYHVDPIEEPLWCGQSCMTPQQQQQQQPVVVVRVNNPYAANVIGLVWDNTMAYH